jgi:hypothetical protein
MGITQVRPIVEEMLTVGAESLCDVNTIGQLSYACLHSLLVNRIQLNVLDHAGFQSEVIISRFVVFVPRLELGKIRSCKTFAEMLLDDGTACCIELVPVAHSFWGEQVMLVRICRFSRASRSI